MIKILKAQLKLELEAVRSLGLIEYLKLNKEGFQHACKSRQLGYSQEEAYSRWVKHLQNTGRSNLTTVL